MTKFYIFEDRAIISVTGSEATDFLQGLISNDINKLEEGKLLYSLMLTPQGRFLYELFLFKKDDSILLDHHSNFTAEIIKKLCMYKLRKDVQIEDKTGIYSVIYLDKNIPGIDMVMQDPRANVLGYRAYLSKEKEGALEGLEEDFAVYEALMYGNLIPDPHKDMIQERSFPLEYGLDHFNAISFEKGCYIGQENTARTKHRGTVRKKLMKFETDSEIQNIDIGAEITHDGAKIGQYCSSVGKLGKALIRTEEFESLGTNELDLSGYKIRII